MAQRVLKDAGFSIAHRGRHLVVDSFSSIPQYHPKIPHTVTFFEKVSSL